MKREIITLCGSTRFREQFREIERMLTLNGKIGLPPAIFGKTEGIEHSKETEEMLFDLQIDKIRMSDSIFVIDAGGYIGDSTKKEIEFALKNKKEVRYYSKETERKDEHK